MSKRAAGNLVYIIFFLSGISSLIYETIWFRVLSRIIGNTVYANSIVISAFMLGLALGSYFIGKYSYQFKKIIGIYAVLEILVGLSALLVYLSLNHLTGLFKIIYQLTMDSGAQGSEHEARMLLMCIQSVIVFITIVIPTFLMGGTLPILAVAIKNRKGGFTINIGNLYGLNSLGAVIGVLAAGFIFIAFLGELNSVFIGVIINFFIGSIALIFLNNNILNKPDDNENTLLNDMPFKTSEDISHFEKISAYSPKIRKTLLIGYAMLGFTSFAIEIVWTRIFQLQLGTSVYSFSLVLGIYLLGSAVGSLIAAKYLKLIKDPVNILGYLIIGLGIYIIIGTYLFSFFTPISFFSAYEYNIGLKRIFVPLFIIFPVTFILGFIFPTVSFCFVENKNKIGHDIGLLFALNTIGCILGAILTGYIFIRFIGTRGSFILISSLDCLIGLIIIGIGLDKIIKIKRLILPLLLISVNVMLGFASPDPFYSCIKKLINKLPGDYEIYYYKEGVTATTTAFGSKYNPFDKYLIINGISTTSLRPETKIMAHLPILLNKNAKNLLDICFGMGTTLRSAVSYKNLNCDVVELVGETYDTYNFFHKNGSEILADKRVKHYVDDGRNFLLFTGKKYDVITIDPPPPLWSDRNANLHSIEFFDLCKEHLNPKGVFCLWLAPNDITDMKMIMKTFITAFPNNAFYQGPSFPGFFLIGYKSFADIDTSNFRLAANDNSVMDDLHEAGKLDSPELFLKLKVADSVVVKAFLCNERMISDNYPYTDFPLWRRQQPIGIELNATNLLYLISMNKSN